MTYSRKPVTQLSPADLERLGEKKCPECGQQLRVTTVQPPIPAEWTCDACKIEFTSAPR